MEAGHSTSMPACDVVVGVVGSGSSLTARTRRRWRGTVLRPTIPVLPHRDRGLGGGRRREWSGGPSVRVPRSDRGAEGARTRVLAPEAQSCELPAPHPLPPTSQDRWSSGSVGEGNGPEGRQFASPGATVARRGRELGWPGGPSRAGRSELSGTRPSTSLLLRHWSSHRSDGSSRDATCELTCLRSSPVFGARNPHRRRYPVRIQRKISGIVARLPYIRIPTR